MRLALNQRQRVINVLLRYKVSFRIDPFPGQLLFRIGDVVQADELYAAVIAISAAPLKADAVIGFSFHRVQNRGLSRHIRFVYVGQRSAVCGAALKQAEFNPAHLAADFFLCKIGKRRCNSTQLRMSKCISYAAVRDKPSVRILRAFRNGYDNFSVLTVNAGNVVKELLGWNGSSGT